MILSSAEELEQHFAHGAQAACMQSMEPPGVGARNLAECLGLQLLALPQDCDETQVAAIAHVQGQPMELLAKRDMSGA